MSKKRYTPKGGWSQKSTKVTKSVGTRPANRPDKQPDDKPQIYQPTDDWWKVTTEVISELHRTSWIPNLVTGIALGLIFLGLAVFVNNKQLATGVIALGGTAIIWGIAAAFIIRFGKEQLTSPAPARVVTDTPPPSIVPAPTPSTPQSRVEKYLTPGDGPRPASKFSIPPESTALLLGNSGAYTDHFPAVVVQQGQEDMIVLGKDGGNLWLSAKFFSRDGKIIAEIVKNEFFTNEHNLFRMEHDAHKLMVFNDEARKIIDVNFINPKCIKILGSFYLRNGLLLDIQEDYQMFGRTRVSNVFAGSARKAAFGF